MRPVRSVSGNLKPNACCISLENNREISAIDHQNHKARPVLYKDADVMCDPFAQN